MAESVIPFIHQLPEALNAEPLIANGSLTAPGSLLIYTVPAGRTLYITNAAIWVNVYATSNNGNIKLDWLYNGVTTFTIGQIHSRNSAGMVLPLNFPIPLKALSGDTFTLVQVLSSTTSGGVIIGLLV